jgi:hypothetical protein
MVEEIIYSLITYHDERNPSECYIEEQFRGNKKELSRVLVDKVPNKGLYVILLQEGHGFPKVIDSSSHIRTASDKVLEHALRYVEKRINKEQRKTPLLVKSTVFDRTVYGEERYTRVKKRLKK